MKVMNKIVNGTPKMKIYILVKKLAFHRVVRRFAIYLFWCTTSTWVLDHSTKEGSRIRYDMAVRKKRSMYLKIYRLYKRFNPKKEMPIFGKYVVGENSQ